MSEGMKNIVLSMIENGVKPVSVCLSGIFGLEFLSLAQGIN
jgi:hypothetical protein